MDCFDTYPNGWIKHYESKQYYLCDPIFSQFGTFHFPFTWNLDSLSKIERTPIQKTFLSEAYNHDIQKGITLPLSPRLSDQNFLAILDHSKLHPEILPILSIAADTYYQRKKILENRERLNLLTEREREVLYCKAQQLNLQEISSFLKISPATINFHLQKICKKLNAVSLQQALFLFGKMQEKV